MSAEEKNSEQLREFFNSSYTDRPLEVPAENWSVISSRLDAIRAAKEKRKKRGFYFWLSGLVLFIGVGTSVLVVNSGDDKAETSQTTISQTETNNTESPEQALSEGDDVRDSGISNPNGSGESGNADVSASAGDDKGVVSSVHNKNSDSQGTVQLKSDKKKTSGNAMSSGSGNTTAALFIDAPKLNESEKGLVERDPNELNSDNLDITDVNNDTNSGNADPVSIISDFESNTEINLHNSSPNLDTTNAIESSAKIELIEGIEEAPNNLERSDVNQIPTSEIDSIFNVPIIPLPVPDPLERAKPNIPKWELSIYAGYGRRGRTLSGGTGIDDLSSKIFNAKNAQRQFFRQSGIRLGYCFTDHITLNFGIQTGYWRYRSRQYQKLIVQTTGVYEADTPVGRMSAETAELQPFYDSNPTSDTLLFQIRVWQNLRYFSTPISIQFNIGEKPFQPYFRVGLAANFLAWQRTTIHFTNSGIQREINFGKLPGLRSFHLSAQGAFGLRWNLGDRAFMFAEGQLDSPLSAYYKASSSTYQRIKSRGIGFNVGFAFRF